MPLTQLSLVNNSVSPRTSESFFLQTRCGGIVYPEVLRNNRPAWSSYCSLTEGRECLHDGWHGDNTPTTIDDIGSVEQIDAPTDVEVCPTVSGSKDKHVQYVIDVRDVPAGWGCGAWSIASGRLGLHVGRTSRIRGHNKAERALTKCSQAASTSAPHTLHMPE